MRVLPVACAIAISVPRIAGADGAGVIAAGEDRPAVVAAMAAAIRDGGIPRVVDALSDAREEFAAGAVPIAVLQRFKRVREEIDEGWRAYLHVQADLAQSRLAVARTDAAALVVLPGGAALYADASLRLGAVLGNVGRTKEAQAAIALALALDPDRPIELSEFSPDVVAAVTAVRALAPQTREVAFAVEPPGAMVSVDGKELGLAPVHATVALGQHVVVARAPLFEPHAEAVAIDAATTNVQLELSRDDTAAALAGGVEVGMRDELAQVVADSALVYADLDQLVLVAATERSGGPTLLLQRCAGAPARCTAIVELGYGDRDGLVRAARTAWSEVKSGELRYPPGVFGDPRLAGHRVEHRCEWCRNPWLIGSAATIVVVATVAVIAVVSASKPQPTVIVNPGQY